MEVVDELERRRHWIEMELRLNLGDGTLLTDGQ
jgi:hypothetical protein